MFTTPATPSMFALPGLAAGDGLRAASGHARGAADFAAQLDRARGTSSTSVSTHHADPRADAGAAREAAEQFVASALILPMLQRMQNDPFRSDLFNSAHQDAFQSQMNVHLADRIVSRSNLPVVDWIAEQLLSRDSRAPVGETTARSAEPSVALKETRP